MATLLGSIDIKDSERPFESVSNRRVIWDATLELFQRFNMDLQDALQLFVQETTILNTERYELPGAGEAESLAFEETNMGEVKSGGSWDVAYPIWVMGSKISWNRVALAYLSMGKYRSFLQTVINQVNNTTFRRVLSAIFKNTTTTFTDPTYGTLTCQPLANGDGTKYPPKIGATAESTENYFLAPNYIESGISNTNNPFAAIRDAMEPRYGFTQGGSPIVVLVSNTCMPYVKLLADFIPVQYHNVSPGDNTAIPVGFPQDRLIPHSARIEGVADGCWIVSWSRMPTGWMIGLHDDSPPPLKYRVDEVPNLGDGSLQIVSEDEEFPFHSSKWIKRGGYAVGNRIGAIVVALNGTTSYSIPTGYGSLQ